MKNKVEMTAWYDQLGPDEQQKLRAALEKDPELARTYQQWRKVRQKLRQQLPEGRLLVLYALEQAPGEKMLTQQEQTRLNRARQQLEAAFQEHPGLEHVMQRLEDDRKTFEQVWQQHKGTARKPSQPQQFLQWVSHPYLKRAAAVLLLFLGSLAVYTAVTGPASNHQTTVQTAAGETQQIALSDGSTVHLMEASSIAYRSGADQFDRSVRLKGKAFFEVAKARQPFQVETKVAAVQVVGTTFGLQTTNGETRLTVAEGQVLLANTDQPNQTVLVGPGQASWVKGNKPPPQARTVDLAEQLAWSGQLFFRQHTLSTAARYIEKYYDVTVVVDRSLANEKVTGTFTRQQPAKEVLQTIAATLGVQLEKLPTEEYRLSP